MQVAVTPDGTRMDHGGMTKDVRVGSNAGTADVKIAVGPPPMPAQCTATTRIGLPCKNPTVKGTMLCTNHWRMQNDAG